MFHDVSWLMGNYSYKLYTAMFKDSLMWRKAANQTFGLTWFKSIHSRDQHWCDILILFLLKSHHLHCVPATLALLARSKLYFVVNWLHEIGISELSFVKEFLSGSARHTVKHGSEKVVQVGQVVLKARRESSAEIRASVQEVRQRVGSRLWQHGGRCIVQMWKYNQWTMYCLGNYSAVEATSFW